MARDEDIEPQKLAPIQGYWMMFTEEQRGAVIEFCECLAQTGEKTDAAILLIARRNKL